MSTVFSKLGDVAEFINGAAFKPEDWGDEGARIIRIQNLNDPTKPYNRTTRQISERLRVHPGDILVSWSASLGVFEWQGPDIGLLNQHIFRVLPNEQKVDKRYLLHALELALFDMQKHLHGATMMHVNRGEFLATRLYLPPLPEQRRIAAILDQADALRAKRREALAQLDELQQAIFIEMFGDPVTNTMGWKILPVGDVTDCIVPGRDKPKSFSGETPWVTTEDLAHLGVTYCSTRKLALSPAEIGEVRARVIPSGSVVISCVGNLGIASIAGSDMVINQQLHSYQCKESLNNIYLMHALAKQTGYMYAKASSTTLPYMNKSVCNSIPIALPPIDLQSAFASRCMGIKTQKLMHESSLKELDSLFASLQHRAFQGAL